jgi:hypothetical protein
MERVGDKNSARALAREAGVPTVPGSDGIIASEQEAVTVARQIGFPVLLKATAGGGGKGMRVAANDLALHRAHGMQHGLVPHPLLVQQPHHALPHRRRIHAPPCRRCRGRHRGQRLAQPDRARVQFGGERRALLHSAGTDCSGCRGDTSARRDAVCAQ